MDDIGIQQIFSMPLVFELGSLVIVRWPMRGMGVRIGGWSRRGFINGIQIDLVNPSNAPPQKPLKC